MLNAVVIDGTGGPAFGPAHIVIRNNRIRQVINAHDSLAGLADGDYTEPMPDGVQPEHCFDLQGGYVLPGFVDAHAHVGAPDQVESVEYVFKLWLAHGITRVRETGSLGIPFEQMVEAARRSKAGDMLAPVIHPYLAFGTDSEVPIVTEGDARRWVDSARKRGAEGVKFFGAPPAQFQGALAETTALGTRQHRALLRPGRGHVPRPSAARDARRLQLLG
jgi:cytosine/adenosine deaminase-related metal-dependent hydrolase